MIVNGLGALFPHHFIGGGWFWLAGEHVTRGPTGSWPEVWRRVDLPPPLPLNDTSDPHPLQPPLPGDLV